MYENKYLRNVKQKSFLNN
ncbi:hypothetical protein Avbf_15446 [Armadillidium vulgare]|nr:hypothetical protein Avbf_18678 [Armadillidium vulgare]RXG54560.1 hypothetical protein Avbf_15446 [Armadillidium vulgare]